MSGRLEPQVRYRPLRSVGTAPVTANEYNSYANGTYPADGGPDGHASAGEK